MLVICKKTPVFYKIIINYQVFLKPSKRPFGVKIDANQPLLGKKR